MWLQEQDLTSGIVQRLHICLFKHTFGKMVNPEWQNGFVLNLLMNALVWQRGQSTNYHLLTEHMGI